MKVVYNSFDGRYSDSPRVLYETYRDQYPGEHVWLADPDHQHGFPPGTATVPIDGPEAVAALESADLVVANTHLEMGWTKAPGTTYLQTWHGTPLKRIHHDVLWAPEGRLAWLDRDVARWDHLVSPNPVSTARLRGAFGYDGDVLETGYPRNDVLTSPAAAETRARVRAELGVADGDRGALHADLARPRLLRPGARRAAPRAAARGVRARPRARLLPAAPPALQTGLDQRRVRPGGTVRRLPTSTWPAAWPGGSPRGP